MPSWQIVLNDSKSLSKIEVADIDLFDAPPDIISSLHSDGIKVICCFSAGTSEDWRPDAINSLSVLGNPLAGWLLPSSIGMDIMVNHIGLATTNPANAIDPENLTHTTALV